MLPLTDHNPRRTVPVVNFAIIAVNIFVFFKEVAYGARLDEFLYTWAFIPARLWNPANLVPNVVTMLVSMFLHGGLLHIAGNMLYLWIFGDNVEDRLGHVRYALFYLLCGFGATLTHAFFNPASRVPSIGASGAIAGVLGAYLVLFPRARVTTLIPIFVFVTVREIPAVVLLLLWFLLQLLSGAGSLGVPETADAGGVAYFAHIGGFVLGMLLVVPMGGRRGRRTVRRSDYEWPV
jgi:membrane associated rhomboid family serine protease